jgi:asparagine synthase (glutamine-hydrolysing)
VPNFVAIVDPNRRRRDEFVRQASREIALMDGLVSGSCAAGDLAIVWAASPSAPVTDVVTTDSAMLIFGRPVSESVVTPAMLARDWWQGGLASPRAYHGFFGAVAYDERRGLIIGTDVLGLFPVYYAEERGVILAGSSLELFRRHELFPARLDEEGLAGILATATTMAGRTLLRGVLRLAAGHALVWSAQRGAEEVRVYEMPVPPSSGRARFENDISELDDSMATALRRQLAGVASPNLLLSGGRDSRMLGGYLREAGVRTRAFTLGDPDDYEVVAAGAVARTLGVEHVVRPIPFEGFVRGAELQARWEQLATGFNNVHTWVIADALRDFPDPVVAGYLLDSVGSTMPSSGEGSAFTKVPRELGRRAIPVDQLNRLLRGDVFAGATERLFGAVRMEFDRAAPSDASGFRAWRLQIATTERSYVGSYAWRLCFRSWPILPVLDMDLLNTIGRASPAHLAGRRAQDAIMAQRFPDLVRLPLVEANGAIGRSRLQSLGGRLMRALRGPARVGRTSRDRRLNYRLYDINGVGWRAIRREAEPFRECLAPLFVMDELQRLLPGPDVGIAVEERLSASHGRKLLVGLMLWARDHLA